MTVTSTTTTSTTIVNGIECKADVNELLLCVSLHFRIFILMLVDECLFRWSTCEGLFDNKR